MEIKDILSIILAIVAVVSFIIFYRSVQDIEQFATALWSCLVTAVSVSVLLVWNPWLIKK